MVECYAGVDKAAHLWELIRGLKPTTTIHAREAMRSPEEIDQIVAPFLGGDDPVFGFLCGLKLPQFFDDAKLHRLRATARNVPNGLVLVVGCGASLIADADVLVYADLARWEAQMRFRRNESSNLGVDNASLSASLQYKRAFFVDWRVCDRWKKPLIARWDFVLDTNDRNDPKLADGDAVRRGLQHAVTRPFRVVPFFDPAPWGGQWMKEVCDLDRATANFGWCFDCVPEENSLLLGFGDVRSEIPSIDLVFDQPRGFSARKCMRGSGMSSPFALIFSTRSQAEISRFRCIRSPSTSRMNSECTTRRMRAITCSMPGIDACVYLGLRDGIDSDAMIRDLEAAQRGGEPFPADRYANRWPAKTHDHFLIPAGTVHCSGAGRDGAGDQRHALHLYLQAVGLGTAWTGRQTRPIHIGHGKANIQWDRDDALGATRI